MSKIVATMAGGLVAAGLSAGAAFADESNICKPGYHAETKQVCVPNAPAERRHTTPSNKGQEVRVKAGLNQAIAEIVAARPQLEAAGGRTLTETGLFAKGNSAHIVAEVEYTTGYRGGAISVQKRVNAKEVVINDSDSILATLGTFIGGAGSMVMGVSAATGAFRQDVDVSQKVIIKKPPHHGCGC